MLNSGTLHQSTTMTEELNIKGNTPIYKQIIDHFENAIIAERLKPAEGVPSMNELAAKYGISKETVKKAYGVLSKRGLLEPRQGKGFFVTSREKGSNVRVLVLVDTLTPYRQAFINAFSEAMGNKMEMVILLHNQDINLLEYYIDNNLGKYDYYLLTPHFQRDEKTHAKVLRQINRFPNRQLILADTMPEGLNGSFGAVYQDYSGDAAQALQSALPSFRFYPFLDVFTMENSLYGDIIEDSIERFCNDNRINVKFHKGISENMIHKGQVCLLLNSQADAALLSLHRIVKKKGLKIGENIRVISYNESPICEILFDGLTTISADFAGMGRRCAEMILNGELTKEKCAFAMIRRHTF